jgi:predicted DNA-binding antitoxin AbrB/MazE fold protein
MIRQIDAIFSGGAFRPIEPLAIPEGTRVHLSVEEEVPTAVAVPRTPTVHSPRLARREDAADFVMEVREDDNAGV